MTDAGRRREVRTNAQHCGLTDLLAEPEFQRLTRANAVTAENVGQLVEPLVARYGAAFRPTHDSQLVAAALDVYYMRYHSILWRLERGAANTARHLVAPMLAYDLFVPLVKGWLGPEVDALYEPVRAHLLQHAELRYARAELDRCRPHLIKLAEGFRRQPAKLALVTASIAYEAHAVMDEVMRQVVQQVQAWPVPADCRQRIVDKFADRDAVFDGFVCATDTWEARLKPHRDLYTLALYQMSVPKDEYRFCVGLEDTEPGIIALRAAGVGCAVALPNRDTQRQNYAAATEVIRGGLPELILVRNLLLA
jgi:beta-phosphoglucomutase-like phosphatase (HAD superfamily)